MKFLNILCDQPDSFFLDYLDDVDKIARKNGWKMFFANEVENIRHGDLLIAASARSVLSEMDLLKNKRNAVIHPSLLPNYKGSGVLAWSIVEGASAVSVTSFEPNNQIDAGPIIFQTTRELTGFELNQELRSIQACQYLEHINFLCSENWYSIPQENVCSKIYPKRNKKHSELDINKTILEQFNLLRVVDNDKYPAFFLHGGRKYVIKIYEFVSEL
jgi:methionyl-tRNA formyltransferase